MLTADLLRVRVKGPELFVGFVDPGKARLQERADDVATLFGQAAAETWTRGELTDAMRELEGVDTDHKLVRGLAKVMLDRTELDTVSDLDPQEVRRRVFTLAAARGPLARQAGPADRTVAADIFAAVGAELGHAPDQVAAALYADLKDEQRIVSCRQLTPDKLLHRYNVALFQSVLLKATWMKVRLVAPSPKRIAQLLRFARFHELMYRIEAVAGGAAVLVHLDGPESLLRQSTRYGLQLACFFPAVLLQDGDWTLQAEVLWGRSRKVRKTLSLTHEAGLVSHYRDTGVWKSRTEQWFEERWGEEQDGWRISPGRLQPIDGQQVIVPAYRFEKGGRVGHLDIVGYWRKGYLEERLARTPPDVVLAVSRKLCGDKSGLPAGLRDRVIDFAEIIPTGKVVERLEAVARRPRAP
ncbi:MAG: DUF790 family protein [Alphaproteobacteria bacterium]|nr:DUF790 family protein [Alphaproteobacteria bacterium]